MDMLFLWQLQAFVDGLGIVAGCIIIGVSRECDADAVGGIFLGEHVFHCLFPFFLCLFSLTPSFLPSVPYLRLLVFVY
uniref:Uncharacterized protein n=1 Tax=Myripristis murdjan TaxID=586833 RepID=A0A667ZH20_9TELE